MKLEEGPLFGALIIGVGIGYLTWQKTGNAPLGVAIAIALTVADYIFLMAIKKIFKK